MKAGEDGLRSLFCSAAARESEDGGDGGERARKASSHGGPPSAPYDHAMPFVLDSGARARILDFVRPLSVGLDGMTNFGFVERRMRISERFLEGEEGERASGATGAAAGGAAVVDPARLFLLAAFAGLPSARRITSDGRESLLLRSLHIPLEEISSLSASLSRLESDPRSPEEKIVHDAMLLESVGAYGVTQILVSGARERMTLGGDGGRDRREDGRRAASRRRPGAGSPGIASPTRRTSPRSCARRRRSSAPGRCREPQSAFGSVSSSSIRQVPFSRRSVASPVTGPDAPSPAMRSTARSPDDQPLATLTDLSPCSSRR